VVSWNTRELLRACLRSLEADVAAGRADVWVVENNSTDGSADMVRAEFSWATLLPQAHNLGFARAVNIVADRARDAAWLCPANADVAFEPGTLEALLRAGEEDPQAGMIAPRLIRPDGSTQHSVYPFPTVHFTILFNVGWHHLSRRWGEAQCLEGYWDPERARRVPWAVGALTLVRREAWDAVVGFDRNQWMYASDLDLGWRLDKAGWATRYVPDARVRHEVGASTRQAFGDERTQYWMRETYRWMHRHRGHLRARAVATINVLGAGFRWLWRVPAAAVRPKRWAVPRDEFREWTRLHAQGLRRLD
jgi:N-acetylglucosaminyl-diphospho-decaprenol L-rhamnosyltransferase